MKRILVADDERDIAEGIKEALGNEYSTDIATSGFEILSLFQQNSYDAIVLDVDFVGGMTGLEAATQIRLLNRNIPILIFSAVDYSDSVRQHAIDIGAEFREKPLDPGNIKQILESAKPNEV